MCVECYPQTKIPQTSNPRPPLNNVNGNKRNNAVPHMACNLQIMIYIELR